MLKRKKQIIAKVMATTMLATTLATTLPISASALEPRSAAVSSSILAGSNRQATAVKISENGWSSSTHAVIINGYDGLVDALTATPYANLKNAPILVSKKDTLTSETEARLTKLGVKTVDIVGGTTVVSENVVKELKSMNISVNRISGTNRYTTGVAVAEAMDKISDVSKVAVVNGATGLPDAVSVAAPAADNKMPIILSNPNNGLADSKEFINKEDIYKSYVVGQTDVVSDSVMNSLPGTKVRLGGERRQETNAKVISEFYKSTSLDNIYVAKSGQVEKSDELVDALAVGVLAAKNDVPVMIVGKTLDYSQENLLKNKSFSRITQIGDGVPSASIEAIRNTQNSVKEVTTVSALNSAMSSARDGDVINFRPTSTVSENITLSTSSNITVNLCGTHSGAVTSNMSNGTLNINGNISNKVSVDGAKYINVNSGVTVKQMEIRSGARNASIVNRGTITTLDIVAQGVVVSGSGNITTLNAQGDTDFSGVSGTIGNLDKSKPVSQVVAQNGKEIIVRFSRPVDTTPTIAMDGEIFTIGTTNGATITNSDFTTELSENRMSMTIKAEINKYFKGSNGLTVSNIRNNGTVLDTYRTTLKTEDKTSPEVTSVLFNQDTNNFEVTLSEPIDKKDGLVLRINNVSVENTAILGNADSASQAPKSPSNKIIVPRTNALVSLGTSSVPVYVAGMRDASGNLMQSKNTTVSVTKMDLTIDNPIAVANNKIRIKFNKALNAASKSKIESEQGLVVNKSNDTSSSKHNYVNNISQNTAVDSTGRTYDITLNDVLSTNRSQGLNVVITKDAYQDTTDLSIPALTKSVTINKDETKPTITSTALSSGKDAIEVTFSEAIDPSSLVDGDKNTSIKLMKNTVEVTVSDIEIKNEKTLVIKSSSETSQGRLNGGNYRAYFAANAITDLSNNGINSVNSAIVEVTGTSTPSTPLDVDVLAKGETLPSGTTLPAGVTIEDNEFVIVSKDAFDYKMFGSGTTPHKYFKIDGKEIPETSNIRFTDGTYKQIEVTLPEDYVKSTGNYMLEVSGLKLSDANKTINTNTRTIALVDNAAPTLKSAKLETVKNSNDNNKVDSYEFKLMFDEPVKVSGTDLKLGAFLDNMAIKYGSKTYTNPTPDYACTSVVNANDSKEVIITVAASTVASDTLWQEILGSQYSGATLEIKNEINAIRDTDSIGADDSKLSARKVAAMSISKTTRTEAK
ncbi:cell wall-binding repeat-containing protein [Romboutsia sedimentorum]|uniref:Cell wall-binding repeat-containing protein n=1 Tax=Romboutsia sedimentorum TaxID=1368474 RepID=A0ABT7E7N3_9FIRM|nr:cell wall-binding repeat-containing protein [Romboutsia sedimentorum]MDK2562939.1 cell wall-binding repeat-containing protein [Romboutsia sedimentorum]